MDIGRVAELHELARLRGRTHVFDDRTDAGQTLAGLLSAYRQTEALVLAIPAGGVPVAAAIAQQLELALDVAIVSKITLPWNPEVGYGAVAFDGTVLLNQEIVLQLGLNEQQVQQGIASTRVKVARRIRLLRGDRPFPPLAGRTVILVDDGLASGFTMRAAVQAVTKAQAEHVIVAVPTASQAAVDALRNAVEAIYCPNIRGGHYFAVADAYRRWSDVDEAEAASILRSFL
jgi:putative phosphoribosyl transferase